MYTPEADWMMCYNMSKCSNRVPFWICEFFFRVLFWNRQEFIFRQTLRRYTYRMDGRMGV